MTVGQRIKTRRKEMNFTIPKLCELTGLSQGFISQVENDKASLSLDSLQKICLALETPAKILLGDDGFAPELIKKDARPKIRIGNQPDLEILSTPFGRNLQVMQALLPAGYQAGNCAHTHEGEEWILVLEGQVKVTQGDFEAILSEGDSIHLDGTKPHLCQNASDDPATIIVAVTPPAMLPLSKIT
ncbi:XRE family transcriptional regulator [Metallumcola ferriviriculae]|uniref:XRE family transcriptional regulator n=1 Tax=Metallumcola ferriviriculae TaxID=3039180 RepID=A0AAU0UQG6_9FIRM|nr:XRE family transcriptional regulator [Desulfitibacteraceae bacterium MK1]